MNFSVINKNWSKISVHILAWLIVLSLPYLLRTHYQDNRKDPDTIHFFILNTMTGFLWIGIFYLNAFFLTPKFLDARKYFWFAVTVAGIFAAAMLVHITLFSLLIRSRPVSIPGSIGFNLPTFLLTIAVSTTYKILIDKARFDKIAHEKQEQNLKTEVSFLRSQISPHFIFNVLNNMVSMVRLKSDDLEPTILKLSSLMQYMLYETDEEKVSLDNEKEYLENYIDLQKQRFGSKVKIAVSLQEDYGNKEIEPMLLIPFVENAFKHGTGLIKEPAIDIRLTLNDDLLYFYVRNKYNPLNNEIKDKTSGIGLPNVTRRLNLLYPGKHKLIINREDPYFEIKLTLNLR